jgi:tetratricopeptide (TPR) repeat protein
MIDGPDSVAPVEPPAQNQNSSTCKELVIIMSQNDLEFHRETAKKCFNEAWDYLEKKNRDADDEQRMLHLAHTARYHRSFVGTARNFAVGDWQISRVYAEIKEPGLALRFAKSSLGTMEKNSLSDILCTGYEAMARAYVVAGDYQLATDYIKKAREHLDHVTGIDAEDKAIYSGQIRETEEMMGK